MSYKCSLLFRLLLNNSIEIGASNLLGYTLYGNAILEGNLTGYNYLVTGIDATQNLILLLHTATQLHLRVATVPSSFTT